MSTFWPLRYLFINERQDLKNRYKKANKETRKKILNQYGFRSEKNFLKRLDQGIGH